MPIDWAPVKEIIEQHQSFVISSHVRPDADAIGSELALAGLLTGLGKTVQIVNPGESPAHLGFLDPEKAAVGVRSGNNLPEAIEKCDVHFVVDTSAWGQLGDVGKLMAKSNSKKVVIDHHVSSDDLKASEFKDTSSPATGCLIFDLMQYMEHSITPHEAMVLFAAIATDTGWFRFPATTAGTLEIAARLMELGVSPSQLYRDLYEQNSLERLKLGGRVLQRVELACDGKLAYTFVTQQDFAETKAHPADTESLVNQCMKIAGTQAAFILVEQPGRAFKASLRARVGVDVAKIAEQFGGGGHVLASGAMIPAPLENAISQLLEKFSEQLTE